MLDQHKHITYKSISNLKSISLDKKEKEYEHPPLL